jgi:hypothetical protein
MPMLVPCMLAAVPADAGVAQLYAALQLSEAQVLRDRQLARQLLQYNTLPYVRRTKYWPTFGNSQKKQKTLVPGLMLRLSTTRGGRLAVGGFANQASLVRMWGFCVQGQMGRGCGDRKQGRARGAGGAVGTAVQIPDALACLIDADGRLPLPRSCPSPTPLTWCAAKA